MEQISMKMATVSEDLVSPPIPINEDKKTSKKKIRMKLSDAAQCERISAFRRSLLTRAEMQGLVDYANPKLVFHQMTLSPFGKNHGIAEHFTLISFEGTPIKNMVLCNICKRIQVRFKNGTSNLKSHLDRHKNRLSTSCQQSDKIPEQQKRLQEKTEHAVRVKNLDPQ